MTRSLAVLGWVTGACLAAAVPPTTSAPLRRAYQPPTQFILARANEPRAVALVPTDSRWADAFGRVLPRIEAVLKVTFERVPEADYRSLNGKNKVVILCGNLGAGPLTQRLYANHLVASDGLHPGKNGFELRTIPDALDTGNHVLFLGGTTPAGLDAAVKELVGRVEDGVPQLAVWRDGDGPPARLAGATIAARLAEARKRLDSGTTGIVDLYRGVCGKFQAAAQTAQIYGTPSYGKLCAAYIRFLSDNYARLAQPPTFTLPQLVIALDQCEENPGMTDADRLRGAELLRRIVEDAMGFWEMRNPVHRYAAREQGLVWNHETYPALGVGLAAQFMKAHYNLAAADYWAAVVENHFAGQVRSPEPLEDSANYQWTVPSHLVRYILSTGKLEAYFSNGSFEKCLDYAIASHDAAGNEATHGDAWMPFGSAAAKLLRLGAALRNDGRCMWLLKRIRPTPPGLFGYAPSCTPRVPADHVGLRIIALDPLRQKAFSADNLPPGRAVDKIVFRSGWDAQAEYMMLDGCQVGMHKHVDGNAIIRYSKGDRYWLVDMDYIRSEPRHHNSLMFTRDGVCPDFRSITRNGVQSVTTSAVAAEWVASAATRSAAVTVSRLNDYGGADWERAIFWKAGSGFVVVDRLRARAAGHYAVQLFWRTLGEATLDGDRLRMRQSPALKQDGSALRMIDDNGRKVVEFGMGACLYAPLSLAPGRYVVRLAAKGVDSGSDSFWVQYGEGKKVAHHIPCDRYADSSPTWEKTTQGVPLAVSRKGRRYLRVWLREGPGPKLDRILIRDAAGREIALRAANLIGVTPPPPPGSDRFFHIVNADGARRKLRQTFDYGHGGRDGYYAAYPYADKLTRVLTQTREADLDVGEELVFHNLFYTETAADAPRRELRNVAERCWLATGPSPFLVGFGPVTFGGISIPAGPFLLSEDEFLVAAAPDAEESKHSVPTNLPRVLAALAASAAPPPKPVPPPAPKLPRIKPRRVIELPDEVSAMTYRGGTLVCATRTGLVSARDAGGDERWHASLDGRVRTLAFADTAKGLFVIAGTETAHVVALDAATGREVWRYTCRPYHGRTGSVATVFGADLDGDGKQEIVAGSDNWHYLALSAGGTRIWRRETTHAATVGAAGDIDGDGKDEILAGTEYGWPRLLDANGKSIRNLYGGPVTSAATMCDADGDDRPEPYLAMEDAFLRRVDPKTGFAWQTNCGGTITEIAPFTAKDGATGLFCSSVSLYVTAVKGTGQVLWRTRMPDSTLCAAAMDKALAVGCDDGAVYLLTPQGKLRASAQCSAPPARLCRLPDNMLAAAAGDRVILLPVPPGL
ncbi:MAG: PQQ-binding-like beta-propeller repeat protein [Kiritimatiellaeota bacterium]|nr:PQQ-binding-like beta-propeller repeat protein [Kiritimatiellota bacterium]